MVRIIDICASCFTVEQLKIIAQNTEQLWQSFNPYAAKLLYLNFNSLSCVSLPQKLPVFVYFKNVVV